MTVELLTAEEVAERLRVTRAWILAEARAGRLAHYRLNRKVRFTWEQVEAFLAAREAGDANGVRIEPRPAQIPGALFPETGPPRGTVAPHRRARSGAR
jgi:excisionase family DNA binding protein